MVLGEMHDRHLLLLITGRDLGPALDRLLGTGGADSQVDLRELRLPVLARVFPTVAWVPRLLAGRRGRLRPGRSGGFVRCRFLGKVDGISEVRDDGGSLRARGRACRSGCAVSSGEWRRLLAGSLFRVRRDGARNTLLPEGQDLGLQLPGLTMVRVEEEDLVQLRRGLVQPLLDEELAGNLEVLVDEGLRLVSFTGLVHDFVNRRGAGRQRQQGPADFHRLQVLRGGQVLTDLLDPLPHLGDARGRLRVRSGGSCSCTVTLGGGLRLIQKKRGHPDAFLRSLIVRIRSQDPLPDSGWPVGNHPSGNGWWLR